MALIVQKYGGSSVANIERIRHVASIIAASCQQGHRIVVVVSAMGGETDRLIQLARHFSDTNQREYDALLATGEQTAAALLSMALNDIGFPACSLTGLQAKIMTTNTHQKARIINMDRPVLFHHIHAGRVPIVTGFQGVSSDGAITTLGRGGSDLTAVALAALLEADECQIFTDVEGVYTSDPKIVLDAQRLRHIPFEEMMELASLGAKVLQNRCLEYAGKYHVPLRVLSSMVQGDGTRIDYRDYCDTPEDRSSNSESHHEREGTPLIRGVALDRAQVQITLEGVTNRPGLLSYLLSPLSQADIDVDMMVQSPPRRDARLSVSFTVHRDDYLLVHDRILHLAREVDAEDCVIRTDVSKLSLVGIGLRSHASVISCMLSALGREGIDVLLLSTAETKISAILIDDHIELGARVLHDAFGLGISGVSSISEKS